MVGSLPSLMIRGRFGSAGSVVFFLRERLRVRFLGVGASVAGGVAGLSWLTGVVPPSSFGLTVFAPVSTGHFLASDCD